MASDELDRFLANARGTAATAKIVSLEELRARSSDEASAAQWGLAALRGRLVEMSARGATATLTAAIEIVAEAQEQSEPVAWIALTTSTFYPPDVAESGVDLAALVVIRAPDATACARAAERCLRSGAFGLVILDLANDKARSGFAGPRSSAERRCADEARSGFAGPRSSAEGRCADEARSGFAGPRSSAEGRCADEARSGFAGPRSSAERRCADEIALSMQIQGRLVTLAQTHDAAVVCLTEKTEDTASLGSLISLRASALRLREKPAEFGVEIRVLKDKRRGPGFTQRLKRRGPPGLT